MGGGISQVPGVSVHDTGGSSIDVNNTPQEQLEIIRKTSIREDMLNLKQRFSILSVPGDEESTSDSNGLVRRRSSKGLQRGISSTFTAQRGLSMKLSLAHNLSYNNSDSPMTSIIDEQGVKNKLEDMGETDDDDHVIDKNQVIELAEWLLRLSADQKRNGKILSMFNNCLGKGSTLTFEEFCIMYEEIATRVEL